MKTIIQTSIQGDLFFARTPHNPDLEGSGSTEAAAVNGLIVAIREYHALHQQSGRAVPWDATPKITPNPDVITRKLIGLWPEQVTPLQPQPDDPAEEQE